MADNPILEKPFISKNVWKMAFNASLGSFVFGYTLGVFNSSQPNVASTLGWGGDKDLWIQIMSAIMPLGAMFGALSGGPIASKFGRRKALMFNDLIAIIGAGVIIVPFTALFAIGRFITGYAAGSFAALCPLYINEITPPEISGKVGGLIQLNVTLGIVVAYAICLPLPTGDFEDHPFNYWWMAAFAFGGVFALTQLLCLLFVYKQETPLWLIENNKRDEAFKSLMQIYTETGASNVLVIMEANLGKRSVNELSESGSSRGSISKQPEPEPTYADLLFFRKGYSKMMRLGCMLNFIQQWSGINAILSYSTEIYGHFGGVFVARLLTFVTGFINMCATLAVFPIVDKYGRKPLLWIGNLGMAICLFLMGLFSKYIDAGLAPPLIFILLYIVFFEMSSGPLCWIYCGETLAARAMSICVGVN